MASCGFITYSGSIRAVVNHFLTELMCSFPSDEQWPECTRHGWCSDTTSLSGSMLLYNLSGPVAVTHPLIISHEPFETFQHLIHD